MHKAMVIAAVLLAACASVLAGPQTEYIEVDLTTAQGKNEGGTNTATAIKGYVEDIMIGATDGFSTGTVQVVATPAPGSGAAYDLISARAVSNDWVIFRPRVDATSIAGADLTGDPPTRFFLNGESLAFRVTLATSNKIYRAYIKTNDK